MKARELAAMLLLAPEAEVLVRGEMGDELKPLDAGAVRVWQQVCYSRAHGYYVAHPTEDVGQIRQLAAIIDVSP